jgi:hypothetical protein
MNYRCPACGAEQPDRRRLYCNRKCRHDYETILSCAVPATQEEREQFRPALSEAFGFRRDEAVS